MEQKCGGFVIHNGHSNKKQKGQYSSPHRNEMNQVLIYYENVEFIRSSIKREKNYVDYILKDSNKCECRKKNPESQCNLSRRISVNKLIEMLPDYFIQVNQSEIVNVFHIVGRSGKYLFTEKKEFKITDNYKKLADCKLLTFFHQS